MIWLTTAALAWTPTAGEQQLVEALSSRDGAPPCALLAPLVEDPVVSYQRIVDNVAMPPWVPMTAAQCLLEDHSEQAEPIFRTWLADDTLRGLAKLVVLNVATLPEPLAVRLCSEAVKGPHASMARKRLVTDPREKVRAAVEAR